MQSTSSFRESPHQLHLSQDTGTGTALRTRGSWTAVAQWHRLAPAPQSLRLEERILCRQRRRQRREDPVPASSCRPGTTGGCVGEPPVPASLLLKAARLAIQHLFFAFFVCIFVSLKFVYLCFMNQPLTSYASGLDGCQCTRTRPTLLLFPFLGSQLSLTRISRPVFFLLLFLNIVASRTCFTCFFCCYMSNWEPKLAESAVSALE